MFRLFCHIGQSGILYNMCLNTSIKTFKIYEFYCLWCPFTFWDAKDSKVIVGVNKCGRAHVTNIDVPHHFLPPAVWPWFTCHAFKKQLARFAISVSSLTLVCWLITSMTLGRISMRYICHSVKCTMNQKGWGKNSRATVYMNLTHCWLGQKRWVQHL